MIPLEPYERLRRRLDKTPCGAPQHPAILRLLRLYCTPEEAVFLSRLPATMHSARELCQVLDMPLDKVQSMLDVLTEKFLVADLHLGDGVHVYTAAEIIPGFWDFTFMRIRDDLPMEQIATLFDGYWDTFYPSNLGYGSPTQDFRMMVREESLPESYTEVLDFERATHLVRTASRISVSLCSCTSMRVQSGREVCDRPRETCMGLNAGADHLIHMGQGRELSTEQALEMLDSFKAAGLVQCADNVQSQPWYLCNCCSCCCGLFEAIHRFDIEHTLVSSNFQAARDAERCVDCGACEQACPTGDTVCVGCGLCVPACESGARSMEPRAQRVYTPEEFNEKYLAKALERGKLPDQLFYDPSKRRHVLMSKVMGAFLSLPPTKQLLAADAVKSRFLKAIARSTLRSLERTKAVELQAH